MGLTEVLNMQCTVTPSEHRTGQSIWHSPAGKRKFYIWKVCNLSSLTTDMQVLL